MPSPSFASLASRSPQVRAAVLLGRIAGCALLTALGARLAMPLPYTPVPVTWQVAGVLLAGLLLPRRAAFASQALYLGAGAAGTPVFAHGLSGPHYLLGYTAGYLWSYPLAAWLVAAFVERTGRDTGRRFAACLAGIAAIYALGCAWLGVTLRLSVAATLAQGAGAFLVWDIAKAVLVVGLMRPRRDRDALGAKGRA